ncbi:MAG: succinylglutamate desuccinylase/aspartoacylase family protein [Rhodospirillales bacterium]|nr:succinylglutamate desuccinylase/aspartoacylase family protein [Rhodospirillales bacterium]
MVIPAIEIELPDITGYRAGNLGIDYATCFDSGRPGPHVMINALTHGNEICGAVALDYLFKKGIRPVTGKLTLSFANVAAYETFTPSDPLASRYLDEDFNRIWAPERLEGMDTNRELERARALRPLVGGVDFLLDIHSMLSPDEPLILCGNLEKGQRLAGRLGTPAWVVGDEGHPSGVRLRDYGAFGQSAAPSRSGAAALLVECGQHWQAASGHVAIQTSLRFLWALGMLDQRVAERHLAPVPPGPQRFIQVTHAITVNTPRFQFVRPFRGMETLPAKGTVIATEDGAELKSSYDDCIVIMPSSQLDKGLTAIRLGRETAPPS